MVLLIALAGVPAAAAAEPPRPATAAESFTIGRVLALEGDYRSALELLRAAVAAEPEEPYLRLELATLAYRLGRGDEAVGHARKALDLAPTDPDVLQGVAELFLGLADDDEGLLAEARRVLERLLELQPGDTGALHALGRLYQSEGDLAKAEEVFRRLVAADPGSRSAVTQLLQLLLASGKNAEAAELLRGLVARDPDALELRLTLADLLSDAGDHAGAVATLRAAPEHHAAHPDVQRRLAFELYRMGDVSAAAALLEQQLAAQPRDLRLRLFHALLLEEQGRDDEAVAELERLHAELPAEPEVALSLARLLARGERRDEARQMLGRLLEALSRHGEEEPPAADRVRLELAQLAYADGDWDEVLRLTAAVSPRAERLLRSAAMLMRADALVGLDRGEEALALLQPGGADEEPALVGKRAEILLELGRDDEAAAELAKLGDGIEGRRRAAEVYQRAERHGLAVPILAELVERDPDSAELRFRLGAAYERSGRTREAEATFRELLAAAPDFHMALNYLGYMWADRGENLEEARAMIERALELDPENPAYIDSLGWVHYRMGDYRRALEELQRAARLLPGDGTIQEHLGDVQRALGNIGEARAAYERALALGAENAPQVRRKLEEVGAGTPRE